MDVRSTPRVLGTANFQKIYILNFTGNRNFVRYLVLSSREASMKVLDVEKGGRRIFPSRTPPTNPREEILDLLFDLTDRIASHANVSGNNMVEKYNYFSRHSADRRGCTYAKKCSSLFFRHDWEEVKGLLTKLMRVIGEMNDE